MTGPCAKSGKGFTLIEMVVVIAITGIIAGVVAIFLRQPVQAYVDTEARAELSDIGDTALRRMTRDLHLALPNSVRMTSDGTRHYIEFLLTKTGGRYLAEGEIQTSADGNALSFSDSSKLSFDAVGILTAGPEAIVSSDFVVVNNTGTAPNDAYSCAVAAGCNRAEVAGISSNTIALSGNPFATPPRPTPSSGNRFQVVTSKPVSYVCDPNAGTLVRYSGYDISENQPDNVAAAPLSDNDVVHALLAKGVVECTFAYVADRSSGTPRKDLIGLSLTLRGNGGEIKIFQQVHIDNVP